MKPLTMLMASFFLASILALSGCADKIPVPTQQMTMAELAISQAESSGAFDLAPLELKSAKDKLSQAKLAVDEEKNDKARRLAEEALIDANLAEAKARSAKSEKVVKELRESIQTLREEILRKGKP